MIPTSAAQWNASQSGTLPAADEVAEGVWSIPMTLAVVDNPYSLCYVVAGSDGSLHLIDPGFDNDRNWELLRTGLEAFGLALDDVATVFATHLHTDHLGMAERTAGATGAATYLLEREQSTLAALRAVPEDIEGRLSEWEVPRVHHAAIRAAARRWRTRWPAPADRTVRDGGELAIPGRQLEVIWTPGHTQGHACIADRSSGVIFTGDHVLPGMNPGLGLGGVAATNPIAEYLTALDRIVEFEDLQVAPGHGYRFIGLNGRARSIAAHHMRRARSTATAIESTPKATVFEIASRLPWTAGWESVTRTYLMSALKQTELSIQFARSGEYQWWTDRVK